MIIKHLRGYQVTLTFGCLHLHIIYPYAIRILPLSKKTIEKVVFIITQLSNK